MSNKQSQVRLGVNIDHVATIRNARGGHHPDPLRAAKLAEAAGADGITAHLREDRRHIRDEDIVRLKSEVGLPLNLEMAATEEMRDIALRHLPHACCIVPEKRAELTTEGGLDAAGQVETLQPVVTALQDAGVRVSLFIDAEPRQIETACVLEAPVIELHTGAYCEAALNDDNGSREAELQRLREGARLGAESGLEVHAGHGLTFDTVAPIAEIPQIAELNIGHFLIGEAVFSGLDSAIRRMRTLMNTARANAHGQLSA